MEPRWLKMEPRWPKMEPRRPKMEPRWPKMERRWFKMEPRWSHRGSSTPWVGVLPQRLRVLRFCGAAATLRPHPPQLLCADSQLFCWPEASSLHALLRQPDRVPFHLRGFVRAVQRVLVFWKEDRKKEKSERRKKNKQERRKKEARRKS